MANASGSRVKSVVVGLVAIAIIAAVVYAVRVFTRDSVDVRVAPVSYQTLSSTVSTNGTVEPVEDYQAFAPFAGALKQIYVSVGQHVTKGQLLVSMDDAEARNRLATARFNLDSAVNGQTVITSGGNREELNHFKSDLESAQLEQQHAATELASRKRLLAEGAASPAEVASAQQRLDAANLTLQSAQIRATQRFAAGDTTNARLRVSDAEAAVAAAEAALANVDIRSPIDGTVYNIPFKQFDWVQFGQGIMGVADMKRLQVRAYFDEPEIGKLATGQPVRIVWDAKRDQTWHGRVSLAPTSIFTYGTRNVGVALISIEDPTPDLIPNTNVTVTVTEMQRDHVLSIPREALHTDGARSFVYRIVDGKLAQTTVVPGVVNLTNAEINSGLQANDVVVLGAKSSVTELSNGLDVKPVE